MGHQLAPQRKASTGMSEPAIRPVHAYAKKKDDTYILIFGLTPPEVAQLMGRQILPLEFDARFRPVTEMVIIYGETRAEVTASVLAATPGVATVIEGPRVSATLRKEGE